MDGSAPAGRPDEPRPEPSRPGEPRRDGSGTGTGGLQARRRGSGLTFRAAATSVVLGAVVLTGFALMLVAVQQLRSAGRTAVHLAQLQVAEHELERTVPGLQTGLRCYLLTQQERFLRPYQNAAAGYAGQADRLRALAGVNPALRRQAEGIDAAIASYIRDWAQPQIARVRAGRVEQARRRTATGEGETRINALRARFDVLHSGETAQ